MEQITNLFKNYRPGFCLHQTFVKPNGQRYEVTGWIYNPQIGLMNKRAFNEVEFQEVIKEKEMGETVDVKTGEVFIRSLEYLFGLIDDKKLILE